MANPAALDLFCLKSIEKEALPSSLIFAPEMTAGETLVRELSIDEHRERYRIHLERFITDGNENYLIFITNISSILRVEEKRAWQSLVRVLSHEINNSLAPLKSFSETLVTQVMKREDNEELKQELVQGLTIIAKRADSLTTFVQRYHQIARLPLPVRKPTDLAVLANRIAQLFPSANVTASAQTVYAYVDEAQMEQVLINLVKNGIEACSGCPVVNISWRVEEEMVVLQIKDNGGGIQNFDNIFTPYYSTKSSGSGIGLALCRQIVEAHEGSIAIENRVESVGCVVSIRLPVAVDSV